MSLLGTKRARLVSRRTALGRLESQLPGDPAPWRLLQEEASPPQHGAHAAPGFRAPGSSRVLLSTATRRGHRGGRGGDVLGSARV